MISGGNKSLLSGYDLSLYKRIKLRIWGKVYLEDRLHEKWKTKVPYYLVNCPEDGLFEDYPHMRGYLECPECGRHFYPFEYFWGVWNQYPWPNREVTPWPKGVDEAEEGSAEGVG